MHSHVSGGFSVSIAPRLVLFLCLFALALPSAAKEESKIKLRMDKVDGGSARGDVRTQMSATGATLQLKVRHLDPDVEYVLLNAASEDTDDGAELSRFTPGGNGSANLTIDLLDLDLGAAADPRGQRLSVYDGVEDVLEVWVLSDDPAASLPKWLHVKERTSLSRGDGNVDDEGRVGATYQLNPNGKGRLLLQLRGVPAGTYTVYVDGAMVADDVVPNAGGNAQLSFRTSTQGRGKSKPHNKKLAMAFDPYLEVIELRQVDDVYFSGVMAAQVEGLNVCDPDPQSADLTALQGGDQSGFVTTNLDATCHPTLRVQVSGTGLPAMLSLYVDEMFVGTFAAPGSAEFENPGSSGSAVRIDDGAVTDYFSGTLP
jgi:hypothetical protein